MEVFPDTELLFSKNGPNTNNSNPPRQVLTLQNTSGGETLAFKVKTTAPKQFVVRPNAGKLSPGEKIEVVVILQVREGTVIDTKRRDKFLVQAIKIPASLTAAPEDAAFQARITELWNQAELVKKSMATTGGGGGGEEAGAAADPIIEKKLRCSYALDSDSTSAAAASVPPPASSSVSTMSAPPASSSARPRSGTVDTIAPRSSIYNVDDEDKSSANSPSAFHHDIPAPVAPLAAPVTISSASAAPAAATNNAALEKVMKELRDSKERMVSLQAACDGYKVELERVNTLRQRRADAAVPPTSTVNTSSSNAASKIHQKAVAANQGVNLQILAALCFISFILGAWLF